MLRHTLGNRLKAWNPTLTQGQLAALLFAGGRKGAWWSPRSLSQSSGTAISSVSDLSPNGNTLVQGTVAQQPTFIIDSGVGRGRFDVASDFLELAGGAGLDIGSTTTLTIVAAIRQTKATVGVVCETANLGTTAAGAGVFINNGTSGAIGGALRAAGTPQNFRNASGIATVPRSYVITSQFDTTLAVAAQLSFRIDSIAVASVNVANTGTVSGNIGSTVFSVGRRAGAASTYFGSDLFDLAVLPGAVDATLLTQFETYLFQQCGF